MTAHEKLIKDSDVPFCRRWGGVVVQQTHAATLVVLWREGKVCASERPNADVGVFCVVPQVPAHPEHSLSSHAAKDGGHTFVCPPCLVQRGPVKGCMQLDTCCWGHHHASARSRKRLVSWCVCQAVHQSVAVRIAAHRLEVPGATAAEASRTD